MRAIQVVLFAAGVICFAAALFFVGQVAGDALWRAGVAFLLIDVACAKLWPVRHREPH